MSRVDSWSGNSFPLTDWFDNDPAVDLANIIADKSVSVTVIRGGSAQDAQTVRIEEMRRPIEIQTAAGETVMVDALLIGYAGHPTITDTDVQHGDRFRVAGVDYEVAALVPGLTDGLQAYLRVRA